MANDAAAATTGAAAFTGDVQVAMY